MSEVRVAAGRSYPASEASGGREKPPHTQGQGRRQGGATQARGQGWCGWEEQPHFQGVVPVRAQEGLEEPSQVEGQEGRW